MPNDKVLTPEQIAAFLEAFGAPSRNKVGHFTCAKVAHSHEALRAELASWKATAEELGNKNVNRVLLARHEMQEQALRAQRDAAMALVKVLREALESAPMPGTAPLLGPEILAGDAHAICRSIVSVYADWWEQKRGLALEAAPVEEMKDA